MVFKVGDEIVLRHKKIVLRALVVECLPAEPDAPIITVLLAEARMFLDQSKFDEVEAQLSYVALLQQRGIYMSKEDHLHFSELGRDTMMRKFASTKDPTPRMPEMPDLAVGCQEQVDAAQDDGQDVMYHDGHPEEYAPSSPETAQQDFQEGV
jgi:hypothetical protein